MEGTTVNTMPSSSHRFSRVGFVDDRVAMVDAVTFQQVERGSDITRRLQHFARMGRAAQTRLPGPPICTPELFRRMVNFQIVYADPDGFLAGDR